MNLEKLNSGDVVIIKLEHWSCRRKAIVLKREARHCQLHGDYLHDVWLFRTLRFNSRTGCMFSLPVHTEPEWLEVVGS